MSASLVTELKASLKLFHTSYWKQTKCEAAKRQFC